jgi:hypothetical protein
VSGNAWAYAAMIALALVLPLAALRGRALSAGAAAKMAAAWLTIFVVVALVFSSLQGG